jgi:ABC-type hemin transport system substrate-binding protein
VIIDEKASLFVSAVGVPPKEVVDRLHKAGIPVMNVRSSTFFFPLLISTLSKVINFLTC